MCSNNFATDADPLEFLLADGPADSQRVDEKLNNL